MTENVLKMRVGLAARVLVQNETLKFEDKWRAKRLKTTGAQGFFLRSLVELWVFLRSKSATKSSSLRSPKVIQKLWLKLGSTLQHLFNAQNFCVVLLVYFCTLVFHGFISLRFAARSEKVGGRSVRQPSFSSTSARGGVAERVQSPRFGLRASSLERGPVPSSLVLRVARVHSPRVVGDARVKGSVYRTHNQLCHCHAPQRNSWITRFPRKCLCHQCPIQ